MSGPEGAPRTTELAVEPAAPRARRGWVWALVRVLLGVGGVVAVVLLVRETGVGAIAEVVRPALPWLPLAVALELARIGMDAVSSAYTLGPARRVPAWPLFASHFVAYAVMGVAPAGRPVSEAVKASLLARWIGGGPAAALGTANQANTLLASGTFTLLSAGAAYAVTGPSVLTYALLAHLVLMNATGLALRAVARYERLGAAIARRFPSIARHFPRIARRLPSITHHVDAFHELSRETSLFPVLPVGAMMVGRAFQAAQFGVLAAAVGLDPGALSALAVHGVYLVVAAVGVMIPGQLGASEGAFVASADILGATVAQAMSIAILAHAIQLALAAVGSAMLALWRPGR